MKKSKTGNSAALPDAERVLEFMRVANRPFRLDALLKIFHVHRGARQEFEKILTDLMAAGKLMRMPGGRWLLPDKLVWFDSQFMARPGGGGVVINPANGEEITIKPLQCGDAWHKDRVRVTLLPGSQEGKVCQVLEKDLKEIVARVDKRQGKSLLCHPVDRKLNVKFNVHVDDPAELARQIRPGRLVLLRPEKSLAPGLWAARLVNIFGAENKISVQEAIVKANHHAPGAFPSLALGQAQELEDQKLSLAHREDWRKLPFVTIDGADARDFDDAIHVEKTPVGWTLRVAIADVSHYVKPDERQGSLDVEARKRGNSWYFPTSVEPMLPKVLSNGLCSLRPNEDRLAMLAEIGFSEDGHVVGSRFSQVVIRSAGRLTYDAVQDFFEHSDSTELKVFPQSSPITPELAELLKNALSLYKLLAKNRRKRGSLDFDLPEPEYEFDSDGRLVRMGIARRNDAHMLIEEFMIAANEAVARFIGATSVPFLYRVHPQPEIQKLAALYDTLQRTGVENAHEPEQVREGGVTPKIIQRLLNKAKGTAQEYVVNKLCLRAMQQARYQPANVGHFGLASLAYCHFTSPIRRYADLLVHRALKRCLGLDEHELPDTEELAEIGDSLNKLEREALECEREMARRMGCLALREQVGEIMAGTISGVTEFGLFVEFSSLPAEGLIRIGELGSDWYEFDRELQCLKGLREGQLWRLGEAVRVRVEDVDLDRLEIRLTPVEHAGHAVDFVKRSPEKKGNGRKNIRTAQKFKANSWTREGEQGAKHRKKRKALSESANAARKKTRRP